MRIARTLACLLLIALGTTARAQVGATATAQHLSVQLIVPPRAISPAEEFLAGLYFRLEPGWHIYWINAGDSGQPPAVKWKLPAGIAAGVLQFPAPQRLPLGPLMDFGYESEVLFPVPIKVAADFQPRGAMLALGANVKWLVCREICIPGSAELSAERAAAAAASSSSASSADGQLLARFAAAVPQALPAALHASFTRAGKNFVLTLRTQRREDSAEFFPIDQNLIANAAPQEVRALADGVALTLRPDENLTGDPAQLHGVIVLDGHRAYEIHALPASAPALRDASAPGLLSITLFAFLGGLILNLMPCVFPVLFIKALALVNRPTDERGRLRADGLVYSAGVLLSFWVIVGWLLALRAAGYRLGWGFQFQSPGFVAMMALLLFLLGLSLAGQFEIGLTLSDTGSSLASRQGYLRSFFTGVLAVVVATPCTAPFMGAAIGFALSRPAVAAFVVFTALALGLATPYLLLAFNPAWRRVLPRPGAWMQLLKQATAVPVFATVIWLVWLFDQSAGPRGLVALLSACLVLAIVGWILGRWPAQRPAGLAALCGIALAAALPLATLRAAAAPPRGGTAAESWEPFTPALVEHYRAAGRPVFVDFTASWCLSCQVNERVVLERPDVRARLRASGIALVRADWTRQDEVIAQALASLGRSGVPTYVIYPGDARAAPRLLPEVLTPGIIEGALADIHSSGQTPRVPIEPPLN